MSEPTFHWPWRAGERPAARALLLERSGGVCEKCGGKGWHRPHYPGLLVHHDRYAPELTLADLRLLCGGCHKTLHCQPGAPKPPPVARTRRNRRYGGWPRPVEPAEEFAP